MDNPANLPFAPLIAAYLARMPRHEVQFIAGVAIDRLDEIDGDPDVEPNGDELDGSMGEDDFVDRTESGPGCPIADPDSGVDDTGEETDSEDSFWLTPTARARTSGPGCPYSDDDRNGDGQ